MLTISFKAKGNSSLYFKIGAARFSYKVRLAAPVILLESRFLQSSLKMRNFVNLCALLFSLLLKISFSEPLDSCFVTSVYAQNVFSFN